MINGHHAAGYHLASSKPAVAGMRGSWPCISCGRQLSGWMIFETLANLPGSAQPPIPDDLDALSAVGVISLVVTADVLCWFKLVRSGTMGWLWGMLWTLPNLWYLAAMQGLPVSIDKAANWPLIAFVLLLGTQVWLVWEADRLHEV